MDGNSFTYPTTWLPLQSNDPTKSETPSTVSQTTKTDLLQSASQQRRRRLVRMSKIAQMLYRRLLRIVGRGSFSGWGEKPMKMPTTTIRLDLACTDEFSTSDAEGDSAFKRLDEAVALSYYWGSIDRHDAAQLLHGHPHGMFLLRDSTHPDYRFAVSFRCADTTVHARIARFEGRYTFKLDDLQRFSATTLVEFVAHYNKMERFLFDEPYLSRPLNRRDPFSLKTLAGAVVAAKCTLNSAPSLPIPPHALLHIIDVLEA